MAEISTEPNPHLNLILLGKTGAGKSASGNTILGREAFESKKSSRSVTQDVAVESGTVAGFTVTVYDTPGLFDTNQSKNKLKQILENVVQKCESGPCVFLLVIKADRFTKEERQTVVKIEKLLGQNRMEKTWILFTRGDELQDENMTIQGFINDTKALKKLVQKYDQRYHVFNNKTKTKSDQAQLLLVKIFQRLSSDGGSLTRQIPVIRPNAPDEQVTPVSSLPSRRIVLLGKTGVGKSAAGNTILGQEDFRSEMKTISVTTECSVALDTVSGITVVDTPGFFDTEMNPEELMIEIAQSVYLSSPGPHAFLIVFPVNNRFTEHEQQIAQMIEIMFGQEVLKYSIILFTHGDQLKGKSVKELIEENRNLRHLVDQCGGRFHVFNNEDVDNREQVNDLLQKIGTMIEQNGGGYYSNQMYQDAQRFKREEEEQRQREEEERKREEEERRQKLEEQRQREEKERKQQEEKRRQEETEKVQKETEERTRAEMEKQRQEQISADMMEKKRQQERVKKAADTSNGFKNFLSKHKVHFCLAAVAVGGAALGGAFLGGCIVKYIMCGAAAKIIGGATVGGAVAGGIAGGVAGGFAGRAADREVFGGNVIGTVGGAVCGAVAGAAFGAFGGCFVGAKLAGEAVSLSVGAVAKAVGNGGVCGGIGGVVGGAAAGASAGGRFWC